MLIQKVFHVHLPISEAKEALANVHFYRRHLEGVKKAVLTSDGVGQFDCEMPNGYHAHCVLVELPTEEPNISLFQSTAGNLEVSGLVEFVPVRDNFTEVQLTVEYTFKSTIHALVDAMTNGAEQFLNRQLARLESWLDGAQQGLYGGGSGRFMAHLPQLVEG